MARLFERFVLNFFKKEQRTYKVGAIVLPWRETTASDEAAQFLPQMHTDTLLRSATRLLIIDAKYYLDALLTTRFGKRVVRPAHLYQIFAYVQNCIRASASAPPAEGILLYPTVDKPVNLNYEIHGHPIRIVTLNLNQPWQQIRTDLLAIAGISAE
jgi:5-methylcytosine-specific restriction enzyme subunit McrC